MYACHVLMVFIGFGTMQPGSNLVSLCWFDGWSNPRAPPSPSRRCASLHYLSLSYCTHFTSKGLHSIVAGKGCRRLVHLDLSGCTQLTAEGMHFLGKGCPILNTLVLDDLPDISDSMILVSDTLLSPLPLMCSSPPLFLLSSEAGVALPHTASHLLPGSLQSF